MIAVLSDFVKYGLAPGGMGRRLSSVARYGRAHSIHHNISVNNAGREGDTVSPLTDGKERDFPQLMQHNQNAQNMYLNSSSLTIFCDLSQEEKKESCQWTNECIQSGLHMKSRVQHGRRYK